jgi:hypothetical protein
LQCFPDPLRGHASKSVVHPFKALDAVYMDAGKLG